MSWPVPCRAGGACTGFGIAAPVALVFYRWVRGVPIPSLRFQHGQRMQVEALGNDCHQVDLFYGFVDFRDVPADLALGAAKVRTKVAPLR